MQGGIEGKCVLITGCAVGIGRATALLMAREGANLYLTDVSANGQSVADEIKRIGGRAAFLIANICDSGIGPALVKMAVSTYGRLDCAVNNAGIEIESGEDDWNLTVSESVLQVNLLSMLHCLKPQLVQMKSQGFGSIVNLGSVASLTALAGKPGYVASKHGVIGLTKSAALQFGKFGVRVNAVCPGPTRTPMLEHVIQGSEDIERAVSALTPLGRIADPEEIAEAIVWLCSDRSSYVTGLSMLVDGGYTLG